MRRETWCAGIKNGEGCDDDGGDAGNHDDDDDGDWTFLAMILDCKTRQKTGLGKSIQIHF